MNQPKLDGPSTLASPLSSNVSRSRAATFSAFGCRTSHEWVGSKGICSNGTCDKIFHPMLTEQRWVTGFDEAVTIVILWELSHLVPPTGGQSTSHRHAETCKKRAAAGNPCCPLIKLFGDGVELGFGLWNRVWRSRVQDLGVQRFGLVRKNHGRCRCMIGPLSTLL